MFVFGVNYCSRLDTCQTFLCIRVKTLHKRLREERQRLGFNQDQFAVIGGVKRGAQINYESGERSPDGNYFVAIAAAGADINYILTGQRAGEISNEYISKEGAELVLKCNELIQEQCRLAGFNMSVENRHMLAYGIAHEASKEFGFDFERARVFAVMAIRMSIDHQRETAVLKKDEHIVKAKTVKSDPNLDQLTDEERKILLAYRAKAARSQEQGGR